MGHHNSAGFPVSHRFPRDVKALERIFELVESFLTAEALDQTLHFTIDFVLEELFTNMVKYNPGGSSEIGIELGLIGRDLVLALTDFDAPPYDITVEPGPVDTSLPLEKRTPGGLGIHLIRKMMDRVEYSHVDRVARITLYKRVQ